MGGTHAAAQRWLTASAWVREHRRVKDPFVAIDALRRGVTGEASEQAVRALYAWLDAHHDRKRGHSEFRQTTVIKAYRAAPSCRATDRRSAEAWLNRIYLNVLRDAHRARRTDPLAQSVDILETFDLAAEEASGGYDDRVLEEHEEWLFDELDAWLAEHYERPGPRQKARTHAEVAWLRHIQQATPAEILAKLANPPAPPTLYKWVERGREKVLLPLARALLEAGLPPGRRFFCEELIRLLEARRRADAGKPRHHRRKSAVVSSAESPTSVQYEEPRQGTEPPEGGRDD